MSEFETITVETNGRVATVTLNRPDSLDALNALAMKKVATAFEAIDRDPKMEVSVSAEARSAFAFGLFRSVEVNNGFLC